MSRKFQNKNKDLVNLQVVSANEMWKRGKNNKLILDTQKFDIYGRVEKGYDCFVTSTNLKGNNHKFVENTSNLTKKTKNEIIDNFLNKNKRVVYLVKKKK